MFHIPEPASLPADANRTPKFLLGQIVATPAALALLEEHKRSPLELLARHVSGDWGDVPPQDARMNDSALECGGRLLSSYLIAPNTKVWVITEASREATTVLTPADY